MSVDTFKNTLRKSNGDEFFDNIAKYLGCKIPNNIKQILKVCVYDNAYTMSILKDNQLNEIQEFMRSDFHNDMIGVNESAADFFGIYEKRRAKFKFLRLFDNFLPLTGVLFRCEYFILFFVGFLCCTVLKLVSFNSEFCVVL